MLTHVLLDYNPLALLIVDILFSFVQFGYLTFYRPFKDNVALLSEFLGEITVILILFIYFVYLPGSSDVSKQAADQVFIIFVIILVGVQSLLCFFSLVVKVFEIYRNFKNLRAMKDFKKANKIHPEKETKAIDSIVTYVKHNTLKDI